MLDAVYEVVSYKKLRISSNIHRKNVEGDAWLFVWRNVCLSGKYTLINCDVIASTHLKYFPCSHILITTVNEISSIVSLLLL